MKETFFNAWWFLLLHPAFIDGLGVNDFQRALDIEVAMVNPKTNSIDDNKNKNTKMQVWLECGKWEKFTEEELKIINQQEKKYAENQLGSFHHDVRLDCGGDTFEEAIIRLARLVKKHYGDSR